MAIEFDAASGASYTEPLTSKTWSHTVGAGENRLLLVGAGNTFPNDNVTGVTFNGVALTKVTSRQIPGNRWISVWYLLAPDSGTHDIVITYGDTQSAMGFAASYAGVSQGAMDASATAVTSSSAESITASVTTIADNCWTFMMAGATTSPGTLSAGTATTKRAGDGTYGYGVFDSNGPKTPAGSRSLQATWTGNQDAAAVIVSFAPFSTNIKKIASVSYASIKKILGVAIANVKKVSGLE